MAGRVRRFWTEGLGSFIIAIGIALFIRWALVETYVTASGSMIPTLYVNDHIFVNKIVYGLRIPFSEDWITKFGTPKKGEVVIFKSPEDTSKFYIKRIVGVGGDRVFYENGNLYVNENLVAKSLPSGNRIDDVQWLRNSDFPGEEAQGGTSNYTHWQEKLDNHIYSIVMRTERAPGLSFGPYFVPSDHLFVMGDNRDNSRDSRLWDSRATRASGIVEFKYLGQTEGKGFEVSKGTIVKTSPFGGNEQRFRTLEDAVVSRQPVKVKVQALVAGTMGNVSANSIQVVEHDAPHAGAVTSLLSVNNPTAISGGEDLRFVPIENLVGRAMFVWLSCEETLSFAPFICHPFKVRWNRFFHKID